MINHNSNNNNSLYTMRHRRLFLIIVFIAIVAITVFLYKGFNFKATSNLVVYATTTSMNSDLNDQFLEMFNNITAKTLLNYTLVTHKDQSITLYAFLPNETVRLDGLPDAIRPIVGYSNSNALHGPNGVEDVLMKLAKSWNVVEIKEELREK